MSLKIIQTKMFQCILNTVIFTDCVIAPNIFSCWFTSCWSSSLSSPNLYNQSDYFSQCKELSPCVCFLMVSQCLSPVSLVCLSLLQCAVVCLHFPMPWPGIVIPQPLTGVSVCPRGPMCSYVPAFPHTSSTDLLGSWLQPVPPTLLILIFSTLGSQISRVPLSNTDKNTMSNPLHKYQWLF